MPLTNVARLVAVIRKNGGNRRNVSRKHAMIRFTANLGRKAAGLHAGPRRPAYGLAGEGVQKLDTLIGHLV